MNQSSHLASASALLSLVATAVAQSEVRPPEGPTTRPPNLFLEGWLAEVIDAAPARAQRAYQAAAEKPGLPNYQSELAILRLWERSFDGEKRNGYFLTLQKRGVFAASDPDREVLRLGAEMAVALKAKDQKTIEAIRKALADHLKSRADERRTHNPRSVMAVPLAEWRGNQPQDAELERLVAARQAAVDAGQSRNVRSLSWQIWHHQRAKAPAGMRRRINAKGWVEMTRLHLKGRHKEAARMEKFLGLQRKFRSPKLERRRLVSQIHRLDAEGHQAQLDLLLKNVGTLRNARWPTPGDRGIMRELDTRLRKWSQEERRVDALLLAAQTPYRSLLFRKRTNR